MSKAIIYYDKERDCIREYPSIAEASRMTGFSKTYISDYVNGRKKNISENIFKLKN